MSKKHLYLLVTFALLVLFGLFLYFKIYKTPATNNNITNIVDSPEIIVDYPKPNDIVTSPLIVRGRARGTWFFEGDFPVTLYYGVGEDFVSTYATAKGDWMTEDYVEFESTIEFPVPPTNDGTLDLIKNNPSDLKELNDSIRIKLRFH